MKRTNQALIRTYIFSNNIHHLIYVNRLLQRLAVVRYEECEVLACLRQDPVGKTQIDEEMLGPVYADKLRTPPMM